MRFRSLSAAVLLTILPQFAWAQSSSPAASDTVTVTRDQIPALVREALVNDPEIIVEAMKKYRDMKESDAKKEFRENLVKTNNDIFKNPDSPVAGDIKNADLTIVEFFDYHCGYCKRVLPDITRLLQEDKKLAVVFKELPILSEDSVTASRAALAVHRIAKDKYLEFHTALMKMNGKFEERQLLDIAGKLGIDAKKMKTEMDKPEITAIIDKNREMATALRIEGTPAMIIGSELLPGAAPYNVLKQAIEKARAEKAALNTPDTAKP